MAKDEKDKGIGAAKTSVTLHYTHPDITPRLLKKVAARKKGQPVEQNFRWLKTRHPYVSDLLCLLVAYHADSELKVSNVGNAQLAQFIYNSNPSFQRSTVEQLRGSIANLIKFPEHEVGATSRAGFAVPGILYLLRQPPFRLTAEIINTFPKPGETFQGTIRPFKPPGTGKKDRPKAEAGSRLD